MQFEVLVNRTYADGYKAYIRVDAATPEEAQEKALQYVRDKDVLFEFYSCGDTVGDDFAEVML